MQETNQISLPISSYLIIFPLSYPHHPRLVNICNTPFDLSMCCACQGTFASVLPTRTNRSSRACRCALESGSGEAVPSPFPGTSRGIRIGKIVLLLSWCWVEHIELHPLWDFSLDARLNTHLKGKTMCWSIKPWKTNVKNAISLCWQHQNIRKKSQPVSPNCDQLMRNRAWASWHVVTGMLLAELTFRSSTSRTCITWDSSWFIHFSIIYLYISYIIIYHYISMQNQSSLYSTFWNCLCWSIDLVLEQWPISHWVWV